MKGQQLGLLFILFLAAVSLWGILPRGWLPELVMLAIAFGIATPVPGIGSANDPVLIALLKESQKKQPNPTALLHVVRAAVIRLFDGSRASQLKRRGVAATLTFGYFGFVFFHIAMADLFGAFVIFLFDGLLVIVCVAALLGEKDKFGGSVYAVLGFHSMAIPLGIASIFLTGLLAFSEYGWLVFGKTPELARLDSAGIRPHSYGLILSATFATGSTGFALKVASGLPFEERDNKVMRLMVRYFSNTVSPVSRGIANINFYFGFALFLFLMLLTDSGREYWVVEANTGLGVAYALVGGAALIASAVGVVVWIMVFTRTWPVCALLVLRLALR